MPNDMMCTFAVSGSTQPCSCVGVCTKACFLASLSLVYVASCLWRRCRGAGSSSGTATCSQACNAPHQTRGTEVCSPVRGCPCGGGCAPARPDGLACQPCRGPAACCPGLSGWQVPSAPVFAQQPASASLASIVSWGHVEYEQLTGMDQESLARHQSLCISDFHWCPVDEPTASWHEHSPVIGLRDSPATASGQGLSSNACIAFCGCCSSSAPPSTGGQAQGADRQGVQH